MQILKVEQITLSLITHLLDGYKTLDGQNVSQSVMVIAYGALTRTDTPVFFRDREGNIQMFVYLTELDTLVKLPVITEEESSVVTKIYVKINNKKIEIINNDKLIDFNNFRTQVIQNLPENQTIKFYSVFNSADFNKSNFIKVYGEESFYILKTREKLPKYFLITNKTSEEFNNLKYKVPLIVEDGLGVIAFFGSGQRDLLETQIGDSISEIHKNAYEKIVKVIGILENIFPDSPNLNQYHISTDYRVEVPRV